LTFFEGNAYACFVSEAPHPLLSKIQSEILLAPISDLEPHIERGALLVLDAQIDLAQCAFDISTDNKSAIETLLSKQLLFRADSTQIADWKKAKRFFHFVIVAPFVLAQVFVDLESLKSN
jgi:hypothetical protein